MINLDEIQKDKIIKIFYNKNNINNKILHIRNIVDIDYIVFKSYSKTKKRWIYNIEHISYFEINKQYMEFVN